MAQAAQTPQQLVRDMRQVHNELTQMKSQGWDNPANLNHNRYQERYRHATELRSLLERHAQASKAPRKVLPFGNFHYAIDKSPMNQVQLDMLRNQILLFKAIEKDKDGKDVYSDATLSVALNPTFLSQARSRLSARYHARSGQKSVSPDNSKPRPSPRTIASSAKHVSAFLEKHASAEDMLVKQPSQVDFSTIIKERERMLEEDIKKRIVSLQAKKSTLVDPHKKGMATLELKALTLLPFQRKLKKKLLEQYKMTREVEINRNASSQQKQKVRALNKQAKSQAKLDKQAKIAKEERKKNKHREFIRTVIDHAKDFQEYHKSNKTRIGKICRHVVNYHTQKEKREQQRLERVERDRLRALKSNDEEGYLALLEESKNERLQTLLNQTDSYLSQIGALVQQQKEDGGEGSKEEKQTDAHAPEGSAKHSLLRRRQEYYQIAHTIKEEIKEQPSILEGGKLKEYQIAGLQWMVSLYNNNMNGILADEMGLGKTIQTIGLLAYLFENKNMQGPFLIVVPLTTLSNWTNEFEKWCPTMKKLVYKGPPKERKRLSHLLTQPFNVCLTTYEYVMKDKKALGRLEWNYIIIDEGHRMKNHNCKLAQIFSKHYKSKHRVLLTGTPLQNSIPELWALLNFLLPSIFNSVDNFEQWFNAPFQASGDRMEMNEEEELLIINRLHQVLRPFLLRRMKSEVLDQLPEKTESVIRCEMSAWQKHMYKQISETGKVAVDPANGKSTAKGIMNTLMQLRKVCQHPFLFQDPNNPEPLDERIIRSSGKFMILDRMIAKLKASGHRILIFSQFVSVLNIMEDFFNFRGWQYLRLDGSTKADSRGDLLAEFNHPDSEKFVFLLSTRAGGLGLNLQAADTVVIFDSDWNPQMDVQAQDRAHRIGQKNEVKVFRMICANSVEEAILEKAMFKLNIDQKIIQAGKFNNTSTASERRELLEKLLSAEDDEEDDEIMDDESLNRILFRNDAELELFSKMDKEREERDQREWEAIGNTGPKPALMTDSEIPAYVREGHSEVVEDSNDFGILTEKEEFQGRQAKQKKVVYNDSLTDTQFARMIEKGEDPSTAGGGRKRRRSVAEEPAVVDPKMERLMKRAKKKLVPKFSEVLERVRNVSEEDRFLCDIFEKLPTRKALPDYYDIVAEPMDLKRIEKKIDKLEYADPTEFYNDMMLCWTNAREYNIEHSLVYNDSLELEEEFKKAFDMQFNPNAVSDDESRKHSRPTSPSSEQMQKRVKFEEDEDEDEDLSIHDDVVEEEFIVEKMEEDEGGTYAAPGDDDEETRRQKKEKKKKKKEKKEKKKKKKRERERERHEDE